MATTGFTPSQLTDAAIRSTLNGAFSFGLDSVDKCAKECGFDEQMTDKPFEEYSAFGSIGLPRRRQDFDKHHSDRPAQLYTKRINVVEHSIQIPVSEFAWRVLQRLDKSDVANAIKPMKHVGRSMTLGMELACADVFGNAFSTGVTNPDGQPLVSTSHVLGSGGTDSNHLGTASFTQTSIEAGLIQYAKLKDERGIQIGGGGGPTKLVLPVDYKFYAKRILESEKQSDNANNAINAIKGEGLSTVFNVYLPSSSNWFMVHPKQEDCLILLVETKPKMTKYGDDSVDGIYFKGYCNYAADFGLNWRGIQGSNI